MPLTDRHIKTLKPRDKVFKITDEKSLYLEVHPNGAKYWRMKYRYLHKEKRLSFGVYPDVSLSAARQRRDAARILIAEGLDPGAEKRAEREAIKRAQANSFQAVAYDWFSTHQSDKTEGHSSRVLKRIEQDLLPKLGARPISDITAPELLKALRDIESRGAIETAHRVKQIAGQIFRYAIATGLADRDPSADLKGALKPRPKRHFAAITTAPEAGKLILDIDDYSGSAIVRAALQLSALFFCRPAELRHLEWSSINEEEQRIEIVATKTSTELIIPLSNQAREILADLRRNAKRNSKYVFPSLRGASRCISENTVRVALRSMGYDNDTMTAHGFRAMARTLLDEELGYRVEWIEQQLAHSVKDTNGRAYNRTKHIKQRTEMMQNWADYLDCLKQKAALQHADELGDRTDLSGGK